MQDGHIKILLIEDNPGDVRLIKEMLSEARGVTFDLASASSLSAGLSCLGENAFDVVLLDLGLPDSQGMDTVSKVYAENATVPIVVLTGLADEVIGTKAVKSGAQDYLIKGQVDSNILSRSIRYAIERKHTEEQIKTSLKEKEVLLREVHHRVKNNLQIICSLINLQSVYVEDKDLLNIFKECQNRVRTMALVHEELYKTEDFTDINLSEYINRLGNYLFVSHGIDSHLIDLDIDVRDVSLNINSAIPCALILNELISNALLHAFPKGEKGEVKIEVYAETNPASSQGKKVVLEVSDNGVGLPVGTDFVKADSLGFRLINALTEQLDGVIECKTHPAQKGTTFKVSFPLLS